jgi:hypothetical protein
MLNELNLVSPSIGSILWTPFVWTMKGSHVAEESITVQYTFPYNDGFHVKNGSVQLKSKAPVIEIVFST